MKKWMKKNNLFLAFILLISEIVCLGITRINLISYVNSDIYSIGMTILQYLYLLPILLCSIFAFYSERDNHRILIYLTFSFIGYLIILHFFIRQIAALFTNIPGIINFVEYSSKIYFIGLPLLGFRIVTIKKESTQNSYFLLVIRIILLFMVTFLFKHLFELKGVLYAMPSSELGFLLLIKKNLLKTQQIPKRIVP